MPVINFSTNLVVPTGLVLVGFMGGVRSAACGSIPYFACTSSTHYSFFAPGG